MQLPSSYFSDVLILRIWAFLYLWLNLGFAAGIFVHALNTLLQARGNNDFYTPSFIVSILILELIPSIVGLFGFHKSNMTHFNFFLIIRTVDTVRSLIANLLLTFIAVNRPDLYAHAQSQMGIFDPNIFFKILTAFIAHHSPVAWTILRSDYFGTICSMVGQLAFLYMLNELRCHMRQEKKRTESMAGTTFYVC